MLSARVAGGLLQNDDQASHTLTLVNFDYAMNYVRLRLIAIMHSPDERFN